MNDDETNGSIRYYSYYTMFGSEFHFTGFEGQNNNLDEPILNNLNTEDGLYEVVPDVVSEINLPAGGFIDIGDIPHSFIAPHLLPLFGLRPIDADRFKELDWGVNLWIYYTGDDSCNERGIYKCYKVINHG